MFMIRRVSTAKISVLSNLICRFITIPNQTPATYFVYINKVIIKFMWRGKISPIANTILKGKNKEQ